MTRLTGLERAIINLKLDGWDDTDIAEALSLPLSGYYYRLKRLRKRVRDEVPDWFWTNAMRQASKSIYQKPSGHCNWNKKRCGKTGICPFGKS